jgi:hypothetical protein
MTRRKNSLCDRCLMSTRHQRRSEAARYRREACFLTLLRFCVLKRTNAGFPGVQASSHPS